MKRGSKEETNMRTRPRRVHRYELIAHDICCKGHDAEGSGHDTHSRLVVYIGDRTTTSKGHFI